MQIKNDPLVTICVPVYNGEKYLFECLNSILEQSYSNWECVVNNNCSNDKSLEIATGFMEKDARFKVFTNENFIPVVPNWNKVFSHANKDAKYFKMVQADDWIYPQCIEKMVELFESDAEIGICSSFRIDSTRVLPINFDVLSGRIFDGHEILYKHLSHQLDMVGSITTVMFSMKYLKKLDRFPMLFDETNYHIDSELDYEIMYLSRVGFIPQILSYTRRHSESGTSTIVHKLGTLFQHYELVLSRYQNINENIPKLYKSIKLDYAFFMLKSKILRRKKILNWHKKYFKGRFTISEYLQAILTRNIFVTLSLKLLSKLGIK